MEEEDCREECVDEVILTAHVQEKTIFRVSALSAECTPDLAPRTEYTEHELE